MERAKGFLGGFVLAGLVAVLALVGRAQDESQIHACVDAQGRVRVVADGERCSKRETRLEWNIAGPVGPAGPQGVPGTNGTDGTGVAFVGNFAESQHGCPNGGVIFATGGVNTYLCNGKDATTMSRPDGPCFDNSNRYVDCGNGTVTDTFTGLIWLQQANCLPDADWAAANYAAAGLKDGDCALMDGSSPGDWRLPTRNEWDATIAEWIGRPCVPALTNNEGTACYDTATSSLVGVTPGAHWSSTIQTSAQAWSGLAILLGDGGVGGMGLAKVSALRVWPVRGGPLAHP